MNNKFLNTCSNIIRIYCLIILLLNLFKGIIPIFNIIFISYQYILCFIIFFALTFLQTNNKKIKS